MTRPSPFRISSYLPPVLFHVLASRVRKYGFSGDYATWDDARRRSTGYDTQVILDRVRESLLKVRDGQAAYERDSVLFDRIGHSFPLLAGLLRAAVENDGCLSVLDFGGSLGSSYFQCRSFLSGLKELRWNIVEQVHFVDCGRQHFESCQLRFYRNIDECLASQRGDVLLLSGVLQYIEQPYTLLADLLSRDIPYVIVDRTPLIDAPDRITVQTIPPEISAASYPAWFFNRMRFLGSFVQTYDTLAEFDSIDGSVDLKAARAFFKGFLFRSRQAQLHLPAQYRGSPCSPDHVSGE